MSGGETEDVRKMLATLTSLRRDREMLISVSDGPGDPIPWRFVALATERWTLQEWNKLAILSGCRTPTTEMRGKVVEACRQLGEIERMAEDFPRAPTREEREAREDWAAEDKRDLKKEGG